MLGKAHLKPSKELSPDFFLGDDGDVNVLEGDEGEEGVVRDGLLHRNVQNVPVLGKDFPEKRPQVISTSQVR